MSGILNSFMIRAPGTFEWLGVVELDDSGDPLSFASVGFGAADDTRLIVCNVHWTAGGLEVDLQSATIGGVAATIHAQDSHTGGSTGLGAAIISALVPNGLTGTVTLNFDDNVVKATVSAFRATNLVSNTPFDMLEAQGFNDTDVNGNIDIPDNGALVICGTGSTNTTGSPVTITGATEIYDANFESGLGTRAGALSIGLAAQTNRNCRYNMGGIPDSGVEMIACSWALAA